MDFNRHPAEPVLAMVDSTGGATVTFARVTDDLAEEPFCNVVDIERTAQRIGFAPDDNQVVVNALYRGPDIESTFSRAPAGPVLTVRMNAGKTDDRAVRRAFGDGVEPGVSLGGLAVSLGGRWVATTLERSCRRYDHGRITWFRSVTLARLTLTPAISI